MSNLVRSVSELFNDSQLKQMYYNIPDYQRGYEWGENNVRLLLEDLKKFLDKIYARRDGWSRPLALAVPRPMNFLIGNNA